MVTRGMKASFAAVVAASALLLQPYNRPLGNEEGGGAREKRVLLRVRRKRGEGREGGSVKEKGGEREKERKREREKGRKRER